MKDATINETIDPTWMERTGGYAKDMTLRDYFAGLASQGFLADGMAPNCEALTIAKCSFLVADAMLEERSPKPKSVATPFDAWDLTVRAQNCLRAEGIDTVEQLSKKSQWELYKIPNMGWKSVKEVVAEAAKHGITIKER